MGGSKLELKIWFLTYHKVNYHFVVKNHLLSIELLQILFYPLQVMNLYQQVVLNQKDLLRLVKFLYTKIKNLFCFFQKTKLKFIL
jgi:hypothetical protein